MDKIAREPPIGSIRHGIKGYLCIHGIAYGRGMESVSGTLDAPAEKIARNKATLFNKQTCALTSIGHSCRRLNWIAG